MASKQGKTKEVDAATPVVREPLPVAVVALVIPDLGDAPWVVLEGDCIELMKRMPVDSIDAIVCDPPYGLEFAGKEWDKLRTSTNASGPQSEGWHSSEGKTPYARGATPRYAGKLLGPKAAVMRQQQAWHQTWAHEALRVLKPGGHLLAFGGSRTWHRMACAVEDAGFESRDSLFYVYGKGYPKSINVARAVDMLVCSRPGQHHDATLPKKLQPGDHLCPALPENAAKYGHLRTALKPAYEPIVIARKELDGTVVANVLRHGTGAMDIGGCRIIGADGVERWPANFILEHSTGCYTEDAKKVIVDAWHCLPGCPVAELDKQSGLARASRFFYTGKPSKLERDFGCEHLPVKSGGEATDREDDSAGVENPRAGAGRTGGVRNHHPTLKSVHFMRWLVRLAAPKVEGRSLPIVLDIFAGSGTTGMACMLEGVRFIGCEKTAEYLPIARARIHAARERKDELLKLLAKAPKIPEPAEDDGLGDFDREELRQALALEYHLTEPADGCSNEGHEDRQPQQQRSAAAHRVAAPLERGDCREAGGGRPDRLPLAEGHLPPAAHVPHAPAWPEEEESGVVGAGNESATAIFTTGACTLPTEGKLMAAKNQDRYVTHVESNVKGGVSCALGRKTLIIGDMGKGKSAIVNSIELALSGKASDIVGRSTVAAPTELLALSPDRKAPVWVRARLSDGAEVSFTTKGRKKGEPVHVVPMGIDPTKVFPLRAVHDAVLGGPDTVRKFFLGLAAGNVSDADVLEHIPAALHSHYKKAILPAKTAVSAIDRLLVALEEGGKHARAAKSIAKASTTASEQAGQGLGAMPTEEQFAAAKVGVVAARSALEAAAAAIARHEQGRANHEGMVAVENAVQVTTVELASLRDTRVQANARLNGLRVELAGLSTNIPQPLTEVQRASAVIIAANAAKAADGAGHCCIACGHEHSADVLLQRGVWAQTRLAERTKASVARTELEARISKGASIIADLSLHIGNLENTIRQHTATLIAANGLGTPEAPSIEVVGMARVNQEAAEKALRDLESAKASWASSKTARDAALEAEGEAAKWGQLVDACTSAVGKLLDAGTESFVSRVQLHLPTQHRFALRLRDGAREVCHHGFVRDGVLHTALSGAEWAIEQAAIAGAVAEAWTKEGQVFVVVPEDRGLSPAGLAAVLSAFSAINAQVIVATPTVPGKVPDGWTLVDVGTGLHRADALMPAAMSS